MGKTKVRRGTQERVLVALSTGPASSLLLHMTQRAKNLEPARQNLDVFLPVHIFDDTKEYDTTGIARLQEFVSSQGLLLQTIPLSAILQETNVFSAKTESLHNLFASCKSQSAKVDLEKILQTVLLLRFASNEGCTRVYLGETNLRIAINTVAEIGTGRGMSIPWATADLQKSPAYPSVAIARPLRDVQLQEVFDYLSILGINYPTDLTEAETPSIYGLTDKFITNLSQDFTGTPSNVTRTAAKVCTEASQSSTGAFCRLCLCPLVSDNGNEKFCYACKNLSNEIAVPLDHAIPYICSTYSCMQ